jgi:DNA-binding response OmpR family regulator
MEELRNRIMLVDDDPDFLEPIKMVLESHNYIVETANSEEGAVKLMDVFKPDLAVFDLMMDNYDSGFILSHKLKNRYPDALVIIATGVTKETGFRFSADSQYGGNWTNADLIMDKGIRPDQILKEIKKLLKS